MPTLVLGAFSLTQTDGATRVLAEGTSRGNPVPIEVTVNSWLQDGAIVVTQGHDNREVSLLVRFFGTNLAALNTLEASLIAELEKPNTLTWTPEGGIASVFNVITSSLVQDDDSTGEGQVKPWRTYRVRLICEAFVRSVSEVTVPALAASGTTTTLVDAASVTTGWTGTINGVSSSPAVVSGAVGVTSAVTGDPVTIILTRTGSITTSSTKYLMVDWRGTAGSELIATGDGVRLERMAQYNSPTSGYLRTWYYVAASSVSSLQLQQYSYDPTQTAARSLFVDNINRTDVRPSLGSARQLLRSINVSGSARAPGRLAIQHETSTLGHLIAYTWAGLAEGYSPPLRQYRVSGGAVTSDPTMVSGAIEPIKSTTITYDIPVSRLSPGSYVLMLRLTGSTATGSTITVDYTAQTNLGGNLGINQLGSGKVADSVVNGPTNPGGFAPIGRIMLPTVEGRPGSGAVERITLTATTTLAILNLDEAWLFHTDGQMVSFFVGSGSPASGGSTNNRAYIEPPNLTTPRPIVRVGFNSDGSDAHYPAWVPAMAWQQPEFPPPRVNLFTVTTNATDANADLIYFPRWHSNAGS